MNSTRVSRFVLALSACGAFLVLPAIAYAGSIAGTVRDETPSHNGIAGVYVCPRPEPYMFETDCTETDASGFYKLHNLPAASYYVSFFTYVNQLNYVPESYDDKPLFGENRNLVTIGAGEDRTGVDAELQKGGVISGTLTDAESHGPAVGVEACASSSSPVEFFACEPSDASGDYEIIGLPAGSYTVSFAGENGANYLRRYFDGAEGSEASSAATPVALAAGATESGIDATLPPGAQVLGRVTEAGTGTPLKGVEVCLYGEAAPLPEYADRCANTDASGNYAIRSLEEETFKVVFSEEPAPEFIFDDYFFEQWWNGASTRAAATPLHVTPPLSQSGIDAHLASFPKDPPRGPDPIKVTFLPTPPQPPAPPLKCGKRFHKKWVKGKLRCVKKSKKHRRHKHRRGPHAVATGR